MLERQTRDRLSLYNRTAALSYQGEWRRIADGHRYRAEIIEAEVSRLMHKLAGAQLLLMEAKQYLPSAIAIEDQIHQFLT